jgi:hypothetical protein
MKEKILRKKNTNTEKEEEKSSVYKQKIKRQILLMYEREKVNEKLIHRTQPQLTNS